MYLQKDCADFLRARFASSTGQKLKAGHAHEIVAAFFGYPTGAALRADDDHPVDHLPQAAILVPALDLIEARLQDLEGLPPTLPDADELATWLCEHLSDAGHFSGSVWHTRDLADYIGGTFVPDEGLTITDALSSEMAVTNALFLGPDAESVDVVVDEDGMYANISGRVEGDSDPDKPFYGDAIRFESAVSFDLVAGRTAYRAPSWDTSGEIDFSLYDDDEEYPHEEEETDELT